MNRLIFTYAAVIIDGSISVLSIVICYMTIHHLLLHRAIQKQERITLIIDTNIFLIIFGHTTWMAVLGVNTILGHLYGSDFAVTWCYGSASFILISVSNIYFVLVNQAIYRLCRVVYTKYQWMQHLWIYTIAGPIEFILAAVLLCPIVIWQDIEYLYEVHVCAVPYKNIRSIIWSLSCVIALPVSILTFIYIRITVFILKISNQRTLLIQRSHEKDFGIVRRIVYTISILLSLGFPPLVFFILSIVNGHEHPLTQYVQWLTSSLSMLALSVITVFFNPPLKKIIFHQHLRRQVKPHYIQAQLAIIHKENLRV